MSEPTQTADNDFYSARYSSERQRHRDLIFAEVYDNYFGQSSWVSTADYDRFAGWLELSSESRLLDIACGSGQPSLRMAASTGCMLTGVDSSEEAIATAISLAQDKGLASRSRFECADAARALRYPDASFRTQSLPPVRHSGTTLSALTAMTNGLSPKPAFVCWSAWI